MNKEKQINPDITETRVALLEQSIGHINQTLIRIEKKLESHDNDFKDIRKEIKSETRWILALIMGLGAIMAHGFHWF